MAKAKKAKQINFSMPNRPGLLSEVTTAVAGAKVNISAVCAYEMGETAYFVMTTDNNAKAKKALAQLGVEARDEDVVSVEMPNRVGELQKVAKRIAEAGINIEYIYGTASAGRTSICILKTADNKKAIRVINK
ncbi:MAG: ACT domain-containing protein [Thermodesulfovibrionales bacterium]